MPSKETLDLINLLQNRNKAVRKVISPLSREIQNAARKKKPKREFLQSVLNFLRGKK